MNFHNIKHNNHNAEDHRIEIMHQCSPAKKSVI